MKSQELNSTLHQFLPSIKPAKPSCPSNYEAQFMCLNPHCKRTAQKLPNSFEERMGHSEQSSTKINIFICSNHECKSCFYSSQALISETNKTNPKIIGVHSKCFVGDYQSLITCIEQKKKQSEPLKRAVNTIIDKFIDDLSQIRQKFIEELQYYGLTQIQQKFLSCFNHQTYEQLTPALCFQIIKELDYEPSVNGFMAKAKLEEYWVKQQPKVIRSFENFSKIIAKEFSSTGFMLDIDSKVITGENQKLNLIEMLESQQHKSIDSITLLYRASQNQFNTDIFHKKCDLRPDTVTLIETEFGKKIGGYTPLIWDKTDNNRTDKDPSNRTFVFSLTHNHKFTLKPNHQAAILQYSSAGPTFGAGPSDIYIKNRSNSVNIYGNVGNTFVHQEYSFGDQTSWSKFSGTISGKEFKTKEWEVFQVKWCEKL